MKDCSSVESCLSVSTVQRRERLRTRIAENGCRFVDIGNSMQELLAIMYLGKMGRDARAELLGALSVSGRGDQAGDAAGTSGTNTAEHGVSATDETSLFEKNMQTTGRLISAQT